MIYIRIMDWRIDSNLNVLAKLRIAIKTNIVITHSVFEAVLIIKIHRLTIYCMFIPTRIPGTFIDYVLEFTLEFKLIIKKKPTLKFITTGNKILQASIRSTKSEKRTQIKMSFALCRKESTMSNESTTRDKGPIKNRIKPIRELESDLKNNREWKLRKEGAAESSFRRTKT